MITKAFYVTSVQKVNIQRAVEEVVMPWVFITDITL